MGLTARPSTAFSWDFYVQWHGSHICTLDLAPFREQARFELEGRRYLVRRLSRRGPFVLELDDERLVTAVKTSIWRRSFDVTVNGTPYTLRRSSVWSRRFGLYQGAHEAGFVVPVRWFRRQLMAELPANLTLADQVFVLFLVIAMWRRDARAAGGS